ncbi:hypothetical protein ACFW1M_11695 [Streptomyces inhibens]|uniref:hypothetical protein n=1 Tax=Streptomyces inhibens TaxID=2293571 RepID=UPI00369EE6C6
MSDQDSAKDAAKSAIYEAITKQVAEIKTSRGQEGAAEALRRLAEAYAWITYPNNSH